MEASLSSPTPTVLIVSDSATIDGGISQVAIRSALGLANAGIEVHYFAAEGPIDSLLGQKLSGRVTVLGHHGLKQDPNRARAAIRGIINLEAIRRFDQVLARLDKGNLVIHVHGWCKALSPHLLEHVSKLKVPVVTTLHEYFLACPNGAFYDFRKDEICTRAPLSLSCIRCNCDARRYSHKIWRLGRAFAQKHVFHVPKALKNFIVLSPLSRRIMTPFLPQTARVFQVDNPIFVPHETRVDVANNDTFIFVGRFSREKGVLRLADAAQKAGIKMVFVGDGHLRAEMERLAPNSTFVGWQTPAEVARWTRKARMLIFPSTWYEAQPLVPIEAAAAGVPCILSDCTAAVDYLPHRVRALHFEYQKTEALIDAMRTATDNSLVDQLSRAAYDWYWTSPWTIDRHVEALLKVYHSIGISNAAGQFQTL